MQEVLMAKDPLHDLLHQPLSVVNIGLEGFSTELMGQQVDVIQVDWAPPAGGDPRLADLLAKLGS